LVVRIFSTHLAQTFIQPSFMMVATTAGFPVPAEAHSSLTVIWSSQMSTSTLAFASAIAAVAGWTLQGL